jgi:hypothetical protein
MRSLGLLITSHCHLVAWSGTVHPVRHCPSGHRLDGSARWPARVGEFAHTTSLGSRFHAEPYHLICATSYRRDIDLLEVAGRHVTLVWLRLVSSMADAAALAGPHTANPRRPAFQLPYRPRPTHEIKCRWLVMMPVRHDEGMGQPTRARCRPIANDPAE